MYVCMCMYVFTKLWCVCNKFENTKYSIFLLEFHTVY